MNISVEPQPHSTIKLSVDVTPEEMGEYYLRATKMIAQQVKVAGFRPGKAPRSMLEKQVGKEYLDHQAMEIALTDSYYKAVMEKDLKPIGRPKTDLKDDDHHHLEEKGLSYTATVAVLPEVKLPDYKTIKVKPAKSEYTDTLVAESLENLRKARSTFKEVDRKVKKGDRVEIDFVGKLKGEEFPGGKSENHPLVVGEGNFIPGFEDELVGMQKGQVKTFPIKFPKEYHEQTLAGQKTEFTVTLRKLEEVDLPEVNDVFAKEFGAKSLEDLKSRLADNLKQEKEQEAKAKTESDVLQKLLEKLKVEVPDVLIEEEINRMLRELQQQVESQGIPYDKYLEHLGKEELDLRKDQREEAVRRVKTSLMLNAIQEAENIKPSEKDVQAEIDNQLAQAPDDATKEQIRGDEFRNYVRRVLGNREVMTMLTERMVHA